MEKGQVPCNAGMAAVSAVMKAGQGKRETGGREEVKKAGMNGSISV